MNSYWNNLSLGKKWLWVLIMIFTFPVGPVIYFLIADGTDQNLPRVPLTAGINNSCQLQPNIFNAPPLNANHSQGIYFCPNCGSAASIENQVTCGINGLICGKCD